MNKQDELVELLENIPDTYEDFVFCFKHTLKTDEDRQKIIDFIRQNDNVNTSSVLEYFSDEIRHIPKFEELK